MKKIITEVREQYSKNPSVIKTLALFSFFTSFFLLSPFLNVILEFKPAIKDFSSHVISNGTINNYEVSSRIKLYYSSILAVIVFGAIIFSGLFVFAKKQQFEDNETNKTSLTLAYNLSLTGLMAVFAGFFLIDADIAVYIIFLLAAYIIYSILHSKKIRNDNDGYWILVVAIPFTILVFESLQRRIANSFFTRDFVLADVRIPISTKNFLFFLIFTAVAFLAHFFIRWFLNKTTPQEVNAKRLRLYSSTVPIAAVLIVQSLFLEFFNIVNVRTGYVFNKPVLLFAIVTVVAIMVSVWNFHRLKKQTGEVAVVKDPFAKYLIPLTIISLALMVVQPWRIMGPQDEFFEFANHGISVDHFFRYGSIPIVETFDAHMLCNEIFAYLYGFLNGYEPWAPFLYISYFSVFSYLLLYYIFRLLLGSRLAFVICLCFPLLGVINNSYILSGFVALSLIHLLQTRTKKAFYIFWILVLFLCVFRLDLGFAALFAGIVSYFLANFILHKSQDFRKFLITAVITFGSALLIFAVLCLIKGINPVQRFYEFLVVSMSNQNWTYSNIGEQSSVMFRIVYYLLPLSLIFLLCSVIVRSIFDRKFSDIITTSKKSQAALLLFLFFAFIFYFNIPRGIVRHTILLNVIINFTSTIPVALCCFIFIQSRKHNLVILLSSIIGLYFLVTINESSFKNKGTSFFTAALTSTSFDEKFHEAYAFNGTRSAKQVGEQDIQYFKSILDQVLKPEETYFDFSSNNYYHALTGRKNPLYVNETPLMLNGDVSQKIALEEIKKKNISIVLMPDSTNFWRAIDGVFVDLKYYMLSEYIYENYKPMIKLKSSYVYVRNDKWDSYKNLLSKNSQKSGQLSIFDFSQVDINKLGKNQITIEKSEKQLALTSTGSDSFFTGILDQFPQKSSFNNSFPVKCEIKYNAASAGSLQIFYLLQGQDNFSEDKSIIQKVEKPGESLIVFELSNFPKDLRLDCDMAKMNIISMHFSVSVQEELLTPEIPNQFLGDIPRVWGEKSDHAIFNQVKNLELPLSQSSVVFAIDSKLKAKQPMYLFTRCIADTTLPAKVEIFDSANVKKGEFGFTIEKGQHQYAIRLSANYYWWNDEISKVTFTAQKPVDINKFAIIAADGSYQKSYDSNIFTLCNITDENWYGGVGLKMNLLLMEKSSRVLKVLAGAKSVQFTDGSVLHIAKYYESGNYIHIETIESVGVFKEKAAYPNNIKIVK